MPEQRLPEILDADLSSMVLDIAAFGENKPEQLPWLTPPPKGNLAMAQQLLKSLNALTSDHDAHALSGSITAEGSRMAQLPCHPRIAKMIISSGSPSIQALACDIAALLEEKDPLGGNEDSDMTLRLSLLRSARSKKNLGRWNRIAQIAQEYRKMLRIKEDNEPIDAEEVGHLIALAYPERIAHATDHAGNYKMSNGSMVFIDPSDSMAANEWLAIASLNLASTSSSKTALGRKGRVFLSAPVNWKNLPAQTCENISWDSKALAVNRGHKTKRINEREPENDGRT